MNARRDIAALCRFARKSLTLLSGAVVPFGLNNNAFTVTLSDGTEVTPTCVTLDPANEFNESQTVLLVGQFGEPRSTGGIYPAALTINTPLFVAASGKRVGEIPPGTSIDVIDYDSGPLLLAATIAPFTGLGETTIGGAQYPNHCGVAFPATTHVVQLVWSGGVTRDGVNSFVPGEAGLIRTATADGLFNLKVRSNAGALIDYFDVTGVNILGVADLGNGVPANTTAAYTADGENYLDLCLQLPARFNPGRIEQVTTDPANSFGLQAFDPAGDTPNPAQTISIVNASKPRQAGF